MRHRNLTYLKLSRLKKRSILKLFVSFLKNIVLAPVTLSFAAAKLKLAKDGRNAPLKAWPHLAFSCTLFGLVALFLVLNATNVLDGAWVFSAFFYLCFAAYLSQIRNKARQVANIEGNLFEDVFSALLLYPSAVMQVQSVADDLERDLLRADAKNVPLAQDTELGTLGLAQQPFENAKDVAATPADLQ